MEDIKTYSRIHRRGRLEERLLTFQDTLGWMRERRRLVPKEIGAIVHYRFTGDERKDFVRRTRRLTNLPRNVIFACIKGVETENMDQLAVIRKARSQGHFGDHRFNDEIALMEVKALFPKISSDKAEEVLQLVGRNVLHAIEEFEILGWVASTAANQAMLRYILEIPKKTARRLSALGNDTFRTSCVEAFKARAITAEQYSRAMFCYATYLSPQTAMCLSFDGNLSQEELAPCIGRAFALGLLDGDMHDIAQVRNILQVPRCIAVDALELPESAGTPTGAITEYHIRQLVIEAEVSRPTASREYLAAGRDYERALRRLLWPDRATTSSSYESFD
ncbi:hypothetical protein KEM56_003065 [Ascosphaera pollenicola]|nr:hypothetical protein KEM56_003065 [Ascosphaera pollenicola]